jgi:hypothetical protein
MFSFSNPEPQVIEQNVDWGYAQEKYRENYMIVINSHLENARIHGDIIAILTPEEYISLEKPEPLTPKYSLWIGMAIQNERHGARGFRMSNRG